MGVYIGSPSAPRRGLQTPAGFPWADSLAHTVLQVVRGYVGDREAKPVFQGSTPFDILGTGYQRPFELATLRLFNMVGILPKCESRSSRSSRGGGRPGAHAVWGCQHCWL